MAFIISTLYPSKFQWYRNKSEIKHLIADVALTTPAKWRGEGGVGGGRGASGRDRDARQAGKQEASGRHDAADHLACAGVKQGRHILHLIKKELQREHGGSPA